MNKKARLVLIIASSAVVAIAAVGGGIGISYGLTEYFNQYPLAPRVKKNKIHFACIGDSITWGAGVYYSRNKDSYEAVLNKKLGNEYQVLNYGLNGRTLLKEGDMPYTKERFYKITHDINVENYIIMLGSNDSKPFNWVHAGENGINYVNELKDFVNSYLELPSHPTVYLMQPPKAYPINGVIPYEINDDNIKIIGSLVKQVGDELNLKVIDLYSVTENHPEWYPDGVHPNKEGNLAMAEAIYSVIEKK